MQTHSTLNITKLSLLIFFTSIIYIHQVSAQTISSPDQGTIVVTVKQTTGDTCDDGTGDHGIDQSDKTEAISIKGSNTSNAGGDENGAGGIGHPCPVPITIDIKYDGRDLISINPPSNLYFEPETIESGILFEMRKFGNASIDLTADQNLVLRAFQPLVINLENYNLQTGLYNLGLINNGSQRISYSFLYISQ